MVGMTRRDFLAAGAAAAAAGVILETACSSLNEKQGSAPVNGWQYASASEAANAIRTKQVSSVELTKLVLGRIQELNPGINAIVTITADAVMQRAREADAALAKGEVWGPLHGVPCTIKDTFETAGVRTTAGAPFLKDYVPKQDAAAVARLRAAWGQYFKDHDAFLMPVDFLPAFPHDHNPERERRVLQTAEGPRRYDDQLFWSSFANVTGLPTTVAPVGLTKEGLPVGVQILGPWLEDATPIFVAQALEEEFGFRVPKGFE